MSGGFTIVDFTVPTRDSPVVHPCAEAPICEECRAADLCFFDPTCSSCQDVLSNPKTTISQLFAIMRQWIPQTQGHLTLLTREVLRRGAHVNDKDGLTDLSLLHFASKAGAVGIGNGTTAASLVNTLLNKGASTDLKCHWTDMNALHYAVFFDCAEVVELLCEHNPVLLTTISSQFDGGNSLHIAAASLSLASAKTMLKYKADAGFVDATGLLPHEVIPQVSSNTDTLIAKELRECLREASLSRPPIKTVRRSESPSAHSLSSTGTRGSRGSPASSKPTLSATPTSTLKGARKVSKTESSSSTTTKHNVSFSRQDSKPSSSSSQQQQQSLPTQTPPTEGPDSSGTIEGPSPGLSSLPSTQASGSPDESVTLESLGVKVGDRVIIDSGSSKQKKGTLRFAGDTMFSSGIWAGVELDDESGRNDGSHAGIRYFSCKPKRGLFVALKRITKFSPPHRSLPLTPATGGGGGGGGKRTATTPSDLRMKNESFTTARAFEAHSNVQMSSEFQVGDQVIVSGRDKGVLRYAGAVKFAPGFWLGVELDTPKGTCDGSKGGKQYFKCKPNHGIFVSPSKLTKIRSRESADYTNSNSGISFNSLSPSPNPPGDRKKRISSSQMKSSKGQYGNPLPTSLSLAVAPEITLEKGMSVFVNKEMGIVQYIGQTDFAPGVWLGVELKKPNGRNDGSVSGKRYFSCKTNYGIFVKPERATHRGINCSKLVKIDK